MPLKAPVSLLACWRENDWASFVSESIECKVGLEVALPIGVALYVLYEESLVVIALVMMPS